MVKPTVVVFALPEPEGGPMVSRLPSFLHPVAGRPLLWHTVQILAGGSVRPAEVVVLGPPEVAPELLDGTGVEVRTQSLAAMDDLSTDALEIQGESIVLLHASASIDRESLLRIASAEHGTWIEGAEGYAAAIAVGPERLDQMIRLSDPFALSSGVIDPMERLPDTPGAFLVRTRSDLARVGQRVRDVLIRGLMDAGVSFILPETVTVDVDVRIGRDSVIYPGVVIEGQTTVGEETVIGPGCRIIDSWVGSGVELKGWNYIAHTSVRNRAILEPYVRRGFN